jgi:hypothetical protein
MPDDARLVTERVTCAGTAAPPVVQETAAAQPSACDG